MKRVLSLILSVMMLFGICVSPVFASDAIVENDRPMAENIDVNAYAAIVIDMASGQVLYDHNSDEINYPASTTKIMTAYLTLKYGDPKDKVTVSEDAFSDLGTMASTWDTKVGEEMTVHRALQAMLVVSASECANVLGEYISGDRKEFVNLMNEEAEALGCVNTHFTNCHGLPSSEHYTTAHDLALIAMAAMEYEEFRDIVGSAVTILEATDIHSEQHITSTNGLLPGSSYPEYNYPYAIGIKTGHTSVAGYCLVSAADKDDTELLCVVMGCGSREGSFAQTIKLYDWAYENYEILTWGSESGKKPAPDAPEYEEVKPHEESSLLEEEGSLLEAKPTPTVSAVPTQEPAPTVSPIQDVTPTDTAASETASPEPVAAASLTQTMLPVLIFLGVAFVLLVILVILLIVTLSRRSRRKKRRKKHR